MEKWSKLPLVEKHAYKFFFNFLLVLVVRFWSWHQLLILPKIWASQSSSFVKSWCLKMVNLFFLPTQGMEIDSTWNYKKWGDLLGCESSHLCFYSCWDTLCQIGDLLELWSMVQKIPQCWWVLKIQCTKAKVCRSIEITKIIF